MREEHPGDWHMMLHGRRSASNRWWGAVIELVGEKRVGFLCCMAQIIFCLKGRQGSDTCLPEHSMVLELLLADAVLEKWQSAFELRCLSFSLKALDGAKRCRRTGSSPRAI